MVEAIGTGLTNMIKWSGEVVTALTAETGALYPLLGLVGIGIAATVVMFGIKIVRSFTWGA